MPRPTTYLSLLVLACLCGFRFLPGFTTPDWGGIEKEIGENYPDVRHVEVETLADMLGKSEIVLVDVRDMEEFEVSHLPGAIRAADFQQSAIEKDRLIVAYCSVGLRSAAFVHNLQQAGFTHVKNLRGSIFRWAEAGYPLEAQGEPAHKVHPYNRRWGKLLDERLHAYSRDGEGANIR